VERGPCWAAECGCPRGGAGGEGDACVYLLIWLESQLGADVRKR
jgi:hypothetical protein